MDQLGNLSAQIKAILAKADTNGDNKLSTNEQKLLTPQELSIWNQQSKANSNTQINSTSGPQSPIIQTAGQRSPAAAVTYGNGSNINQATGDKAEIVSTTTYTDLNIDSETAQALIDAGFTTPEDAAFIKSAHKRGKDLGEILSTNQKFGERKIDAETARAMVRAGVIGDTQVQNLDVLLKTDEFKNLDPTSQKLLLQNIKYPNAIMSATHDADFDKFQLSEDGKHVVMSSSKHGFSAKIGTQDNDALERLDIQCYDRTIAHPETGKPMNQRAIKINFPSSDAVFEYRNDPPFSGGVHAYLYEAGEGAEGAKAESLPFANLSGKKMHIHIISSAENEPIQNNISYYTNNTSATTPDEMYYTERYTERDLTASDNKNKKVEKQVKVALKAGSTHIVGQSELDNYDGFRQKNGTYYQGTYVHSHINTTRT